jgi:hypothetical protein
MAQNNPSTIEFLKTSHKRVLPQSNGPALISFFNEKLDINRFLIEDSTGNKGAGADMPQVEFGANAG